MTYTAFKFRILFIKNKRERKRGREVHRVEKRYYWFLISSLRRAAKALLRCVSSYHRHLHCENCMFLTVCISRINYSVIILFVTDKFDVIILEQWWNNGTLIKRMPYLKTLQIKYWFFSVKFMLYWLCRKRIINASTQWKCKDAKMNWNYSIYDKNDIINISKFTSRTIGYLANTNSRITLML